MDAAGGGVGAVEVERAAEHSSRPGAGSGGRDRGPRRARSGGRPLPELAQPACASAGIAWLPRRPAGPSSGSRPNLMSGWPFTKNCGVLRTPRLRRSARSCSRILRIRGFFHVAADAVHVHAGLRQELPDLLGLRVVVTRPLGLGGVHQLEGLPEETLQCGSLEDLDHRVGAPMERRVAQDQANLARVLGQHGFDVGIERAAGLTTRVEELDQDHLGVRGTETLRVGPFERASRQPSASSSTSGRPLGRCRRAAASANAMTSPAAATPTMVDLFTKLASSSATRAAPSTVAKTSRDSMGMDTNPKRANCVSVHDTPSRHGAAVSGIQPTCRRR